ncbi:MAG: sigma-70 family RNA polymerase sigma factor [Candidatus Pedobacter colombiensis]|uniref:Sigma-70 family RNA polymerase sigma factor n=1 Tax=Candidatus Pedobacter colombiensis TaxID=3121371 RepID=A0AAJ6BA33_9SPHI|nr:sigma-70 family RNA polymerase sigma factor [Pedobacter sp.]WEK20853.1 MAG: sigma-70 family RNA polymerase sigma factor [Pedobacter sp.]
MSDYKKYSDVELVRLLKTSDHAAFTEIYNRYFYLLYVHAVKKLQDGDLAKDILHELFTKLWIRREWPLTAENLIGYLYTLTKNRILDHFTHLKVEAKYIASLKNFMATGNDGRTDALVRENELNTQINKEIDALPRKMREIFVLSRKEQLTYKEIAQKLNTNENNVSKQVNNGIRILRKKLS